MIEKASPACVALLLPVALMANACVPDGEIKALSDVTPPEHGVTQGYICDAAPVQFFVDKKVSAKLGEQALIKSGAKYLRWIPPRSAVTMDLRTDRLNIRYNDFSRILSINCG